MIVRKDLPLGILCANLVHAAGESSPGNLPEGTHAVVLMVPDEVALVAVVRELEKSGVACRRIVESDHPYVGQTMAVGVCPGRKEILRKHFSSLPLLR